MKSYFNMYNHPMEFSEKLLHIIYNYWKQDTHYNSINTLNQEFEEIFHVQ